MMRRWTLTDAFQERYRHITGTPVEQDVRPYFEPVARIEAVAVRELSDEALGGRARAVRGRAVAGEPLDDLLPEVFAIAREVSARRVAIGA